MNLRTTFKAHNVTFEILARSSRKKGISVFGRKKVGTAKFKLGLRTVFKMDAEAAAMERYNAMIAEAKAAGWVVAAERAGAVGFTEMPAPPTAPVEQTEPAATAVGTKKSDKAPKAEKPPKK